MRFERTFILAALGLAALLRASEVGFAVLRIAGACYLGWLGISALRSARHPSGEPTSRGSARRGLLGTGFLAGLVTNLLNPKIGVFYVAVLPQFLPDGVPASAGGAGLALVHVVEGMAWFTVLILATHVLRAWLGRPSVQRWIDRITGGVLIGFGLKLALSRA